MSEAITNAVEETIEALRRTFEATPTLFYTENDLVCWFVADLVPRLPDGGLAPDAEGKPHRLVHTEFPTPFRCDMRDGGFCIREDYERTEEGGRFRRASRLKVSLCALMTSF